MTWIKCLRFGPFFPASLLVAYILGELGDGYSSYEPPWERGLLPGHRTQTRVAGRLF